PRRPALRVGNAAPEIDDGTAVEDGSEGGAELPPLGEVRLERVGDALEAGGDEAARRHGNELSHSWVRVAACRSRPRSSPRGAVARSRRRRRAGSTGFSSGRAAARPTASRTST